jgi:hypothetical protein
MTRKTRRRWIALLLAPLALVLIQSRARATQQVSCDAISGAGQLQTTGKSKFGMAAGVKDGAFWGHVLYEDDAAGLKVEARSITAYSAGGPGTRVVEGIAKTNLYGDRSYRITSTDNGRQGAADQFRLELDNGYVMSAGLRKGEIRIQKGNRKSTPPPGCVCSGAYFDAQAPAVAITSPAGGATVAGTATVSASASDDVGVASVQFELDGAPLGNPVAAPPYQVGWNTTSVADGPHTLAALARDDAGNPGTSAPVTVTVRNDTTPPAVSITSPASGAMVSGPITVSANASDDVAVAGVQFLLDGAPLGAEDLQAPYAAPWDTTTASNGTHSLAAVARDSSGNTATSAPVSVTVANLPPAPPPPAAGKDVFVALTNGQVQWRTPEGLLRQVLLGTSDGQSSSLAFDSAQRLYVPHWYSRQTLPPGNTIERFDASGVLIPGYFGTGFNCDPSSMAFDSLGNVYVGQADCTGDILKFDAAGNLLASYDVPTTNRGTDHIYLAADNCTMFYTSRDQNIYRYNVCTRTPLANFNLQPLPGSNAYHIAIMPGGGVLVADSEVVVRLDATGNQVQTYNVPGQTGYLYGGVDFVGDGTFWASNGYNGNVYRFDILTGAVLASFNTLSGDLTAAGVAVRR